MIYQSFIFQNFLEKNFNEEIADTFIRLFDLSGGLDIDIEKEILQVEGIKNIHHVHLWQLNDHDCHFEAHIQFKQDIRLSEFDQKCQQVERILKEKFHISHSNLQPEFFRDDHKEIIIQD